MSRRMKLLLHAAAVVSLGAIGPGASAQFTEVSTGNYQTPENIAPVPMGFGSLAGGYLIPDGARDVTSNSVIWYLSPSFGTPTPFASGLSQDTVGGTFAPNTANWGSYANTFMAVGFSGQVNSFDSSGNATLATTITNAYLAQAIVAPVGSAYAGDIVVTDENRNIDVLNATAGQITVNTISMGSTVAAPSYPFGEAFAPSGFGNIGGDLLFDDLDSGNIYTLDSSGNVAQFADINLCPGQTGLRQMAFAPAGFFPNYAGQALLVSVSGSQAGGGTLGGVVALNANGTPIFSLRTDLGLTAFDPRGLTFSNNTDLLISDASDPIYLATAAAFVPEPGTTGFLLGFVATGALVHLRRRKLAR